MAALDDSNKYDARPWWRRNLIALAIAAVVVVALIAWRLWPSSSGDAQKAGTDKSAQAQPGKGGGKGGSSKNGGGDPNRAQPVSVAAAKTADLNIVQTALGT